MNLPFHECQGNECKGVGTWFPVFVLRCKGASKAAPGLRAILPVYLCDECKVKVTLRELLTDNGWIGICGQVLKAGRKVPKMNMTTLDFTEVGSQEAVSFFRNAVQPHRHAHGMV